MKLVVSLLALTALGAAAVQDFAPAAKTKQHEWLQQLVGEWTVTCEMPMGPGGELTTMKSTESVRSVGGLWVVGEGKADFNGMPMTTIMTLGYDPARQKFVGTWIDTMQTHMWNYIGTLDEAGKILTLETQGPDFEDPTKTVNYRDVIEIVGRDQKVLTSHAQQADGSWKSIMRADYSRKK